MKINGKTRVCGLIGKPVEHTMSPVIHNSLSEELGMDLTYVPFLVEEDLKAAVCGAYALNLLGLNITVPYKEEVLNYIGEIDPLAKQIGAVNTLVRKKDGFKGYNTDITGLYRAMQSEGIHLSGESVILLGAGGAARSVACLCSHYHAEKVYLLNRTIEKAEEIAKEINGLTARELVIPMGLTEYEKLPEKKMLCIQASSVGLAPHTEDVIIEDPAFYERIHTGYDLIYRPANTKFMRLVREHGGQAYHGLKMLLYQGIEAYELWNDIQVEDTLCNEIYELMKGEMGIEE